MMGKPTLTTASFSDGIKVEFIEVKDFCGVSSAWASVYDNGDNLWCAQVSSFSGWSITVPPERTGTGKTWKSDQCYTIWVALIEALDAGILGIHEVNVSRIAIDHIRKFGMKWIDDFVEVDGGEVE